MQCGEDSGDPDPGFLNECWAYDAREGWADGAGYFFFAPLGLVLVGSVITVFAKRPTALAIVAIVSLGLAFAGFLAGPLLFD